MPRYRHFSLHMGRSPSFASAAADYTPYSGSLSLRLRTSWPLASPATATRRLIMQKARRHPSKRAPTACRRTVSGSLSLPCSGSFSPFPHGTCPLSVSWEYLALPDGAGRFGQDSSGPALLRIPSGPLPLRVRGFHPLRRAFPSASARLRGPSRRSFYPARALTPAVWAPPLSLAATGGITVVLFSCGYLDVSVPRVRPAASSAGCPAFSRTGCPIRIPPDLRPFAPPRGFSQLVASFFASKSLGIPRAPFSLSSLGPRRRGPSLFPFQHVNELAPAIRGLHARSAGLSRSGYFFHERECKGTTVFQTDKLSSRFFLSKITMDCLSK